MCPPSIKLSIGGAHQAVRLLPWNVSCAVEDERGKHTTDCCEAKARSVSVVIPLFARCAIHPLFVQYSY